MQSGINGVGPSFRGSLVVKVFDRMENGRQYFSSVKIFETGSTQDRYIELLAGKARQADGEEKSSYIATLFGYLNELKLKIKNEEALKLPPTTGRGYSVSIGPSNIFIAKSGLQKGDVNLQLMNLDMAV